MKALNSIFLITLFTSQVHAGDFYLLDAQCRLLGPDGPNIQMVEAEKTMSVCFEVPGKNWQENTYRYTCKSFDQSAYRPISQINYTVKQESKDALWLSSEFGLIAAGAYLLSGAIVIEKVFAPVAKNSGTSVKVSSSVLVLA